MLSTLACYFLLTKLCVQRLMNPGFHLPDYITVWPQTTPPFVLIPSSLPHTHRTTAIHACMCAHAYACPSSTHDVSCLLLLLPLCLDYSNGTPPRANAKAAMTLLLQQKVW